jgi:hypothetical protein
MEGRTTAGNSLLGDFACASHAAEENNRAMVAARIANMRQGARTDLQPSANLPEVSRPQAAAMLNVSERTVRSVRTVRDCC